jgi:hypothetical protein
VARVTWKLSSMRRWTGRGGDWQNAEQRKDLDQERDARHWEIVNGCKLNNREAAERVRERLLAAGLTDEQIRGLGVTEHSMKAVTRLRRKP